MRVLNVHEEGRWGGPQKRTAHVARELKRYGVDTLVLCPVIDSRVFQSALREANVKVKVIKLHRLTKDKKHLARYVFRFLQEVKEIKKIIIENKIELVHINGSFQIKGLIAAKLAGVTCVWHLNDTYAIKPLKLLFDRLLKQRADGFIVAGDRVKEYYLGGLDNSSTFVEKISAPVDMAHFGSDVGHADLPGDSGNIKVTMIGNWSEIKGHNLFVQIARYVREVFEISNIEFYIVGQEIENQSTYISNIKRTIDKLNIDNIHILGQREDIPAILSRTDIYVCCSNFEASPTAVWEAMAMAIPVVSTDVGDVKQVVDGNNAGFVCSNGSPKKMAEYVSKLADDEILREKMGRIAKNIAEAEFSLNNVTKSHFLIYQKLIKA